MNRRDMMKIAALAGVTGATCLAMTESKKKREKPDHLEHGQLWRLDDGRWVLINNNGMEGYLQAHWFSADRKPLSWEYIVLRGTIVPAFVRCSLTESQVIREWHYCRNIFDRGVGQ